MAEQQTNFTSLGGVWLDQIILTRGEVHNDVVGGSATYAILGARLFEDKSPARIKLIINAGFDFPKQVIAQIRMWRISVNVLVNQHKPCTRGILEHLGSAGSRFTRLTPPLLTSPQDVAISGALDSQIFHMFAVPDLVQSQCLQLAELRNSNNIPGQPVVIWEPHPKSCTTAMLKEHRAILFDNAITVFSPNHHELNALFDDTPTVFDRTILESRARSLFNAPKFVYDPIQQNGPGVQVIVIRAAEHGCLVLQQASQAAIWLPSFYGADEQDHVVDPTGCGNAFLGGMAQGWLETHDWTRAACYGSVAASVIIEHVGPPSLGSTTPETWSGIDVRQRLADYITRAEVHAVL